MFEFCEPYLQERIEAAKAKAKRIAEGTEATEEGIILIFRFHLAKQLHIGIFDDYFEKRTLDELAFERFLYYEFELQSNPEYQKQKYKEEYQKAIETAEKDGVACGLFPDEKWEEIKLDQEFIE